MARKFTRKPELQDEIVLESLNRLQKLHGPEFKASVATIRDHVDKRRTANPPSPATIMKALERLNEKGAINMHRNGQRGQFTFTFGKAVRAAAAAAVPAETAAAVKRGRGRPRKTEAVVVAESPTVTETEDEDLENMVRRLQTLTERRDNLKAQIQAKLNKVEEEITGLEKVVELIAV